MKNTEEHYFNPEHYTIRQIDKNIAKKLIITNHYTHKWTLCNVALGVFKCGEENSFIEGVTNDKLIGVCVYGIPVGGNVMRGNGISPLLKNGSVFELTRLWLEDGHGKNIESWTIAQTFEWLKKNRPQLKLLISYADPDAGHLGKIYQATNWLYQFIENTSDTADFYVSFQPPPNYNWIHSRTISSRYGGRNKEIMSTKLPKPYWMKTLRRKFRYIYFLCDKREKLKIMKTLTHKISKYPSKIEGVTEIKMIS